MRLLLSIWSLLYGAYICVPDRSNAGGAMLSAVSLIMFSGYLLRKLSTEYGIMTITKSDISRKREEKLRKC